VSYHNLWQKQLGRSVGFVNGCFDLLHNGHLELLKKSKEVCSYLVVAINADASVKAIKGETRPIIDEQTRAEMLHALKYVDEVIIFDEETPIEVIGKIVPDFIFKGKEYEGRELREQTIADEIEATFIFFETADQSTTNIIKKIKDE
jgi:D-beta-D-heptose 7-phosphate kinase/D-beta-D-heptose 1-phosphate adenosyltransferase